MSNAAGPAETATRSHDDPYILTPEGVKVPPRGWKASARFLGPGLVVSASIVGSGELITTTALGAEAGFVLLWLVVFSTLVKVAVQVEIARWAIVTGQPGLTGFNRVPPHVGRLGWITILWILMALVKILQVGGVVGGLAAALSIMMPIGGDPLGFTSLAVWTAITVVLAIVTLISNHYQLIEKGAVALTLAFVLIVCVIAFGLPFTEIGYTGADLAGGLSFQLPAGLIGVGLAMFGLTGAASDEITAYTYWCVEKGYARWTGPRDDSSEWTSRARGWIGVMYKDAILSWVVYTIGTLAFYILGAAVLHPRGLVPEGNDMIITLQNTFTQSLGEWAGLVYLLGAVAVLGSTLWAALPAWARVASNAVSLLGVYEWTDTRTRLRTIRIFTVLFPIAWGIAYLWLQTPVIMVASGGIVGGIFLLGVTVAAWYLRRTEVPENLRGGPTFVVALLVSSVAIIGLGIYTAASSLIPLFS